MEEGDNPIRFWEWKVEKASYLFYLFCIPGTVPLVITVGTHRAFLFSLLPLLVRKDVNTEIPTIPTFFNE